MEPIEAERHLADALATGDESRAILELEAVGRCAIEFTGRCYAYAITNGMVDAALAFGRAGFHLNVMDEPSVQAELATSGGATRGLVDFMQRYRYCKAQRTYYLSVVQAPAAIGPVRALLEEGVGLTDRDKAELLSLAVRQDNVDLARTLVAGGARLADDIHDAAPSELAAKMSVAASENPWADQLSPRSSMAMIAFVIEQMGEEPCPVRADWFKLYFRDSQFADKLALIALHAGGETCEDAASLLRVLARDGKVDAVRAVLDWSGLDPDALDDALTVARESAHVEITALLLQARHGAPQALEPLAF